MSEEEDLTLKLAKQLGILRTRKVSNLLHGGQTSSKPLLKEPLFSYYIVIDFESTCWRDKKGANPSPEIIEFPAVLYDAKRRTMPEGSDFQQYVMPTEQPVLSNFCTELTGITQDKVDAGCPLPTTLYLFNSWIRDLTVKFNLCFNEIVKGKNLCAFVTWTDWDLKICLENECKRKGIVKPKILNAWIDLKYIYKKFYGRKPQGLSGALKETGLDFDGREHSGFCDAQNTAKLLGKMLDDKCALGITKAINGIKIENSLQYDESSFDAASIKKFFEKKADVPKSTHSRFSKSNSATSCSKTASNLSNTSGQLQKMEGKKSSSLHQAKISNVTTPQNTPRLGLSDVTNQQKSSGYQEKKDTRLQCRSTPPLCPCGRRSKRLFVSKPGPNQGRSFFTCSLKSLGSTSKSSGCKFFVWDSDQGQSPNLTSRIIPNQSFKTPSCEETSKSCKSKTAFLNSNYEPECKRAKLNFNSPGFSTSSVGSPMSVSAQYFGNVPLQNY